MIQHSPTPTELDDLELLASGAYAPLTRFNEPGSPVTLELPPETEGDPEGAWVELVDPEGLPLARVGRASGAVETLTHPQYGPFRRLHLTPAQARATHRGATWVPVSGPLTDLEVEELRGLGRVVLLALMGTGTGDLSPVALVRTTLAAAALLDDAAVVAVPLPSHGDATADHDLGRRVVANYAASDPVHALRSAEEDDESGLPGVIAAIVDEDRPAPEDQGLVLFFTGLSGSGKSTLARALMDRLLERGGRHVTSLDGDVVRRNLSAGLTFSKADRETNIRRIGWVAAEIGRHGGVAVCSPIAPFAQTRAQVREMVESAGGAFFLVHVATPLEECERRDRKGLYAKARRGEIPEFTGISSPYEEPDDAAVRVDTTGRSIEDALGDVVDALHETGHLDLRDAVAATDGPSPATDDLAVLFVCTANICRSPWLEQSARSLAGEGSGLRFASAGTSGFDGHPMEPTMAAMLAQEGHRVDATFRSRALTPDLVESADLVLTAEAGHRALILDDSPRALRKVFTVGQFAAFAADHPELRGRALVEAAGQRRTAADPALDIADPYRRGNAAASNAAGTMSRMLGVIVPALKAE